MIRATGVDIDALVVGPGGGEAIAGFGMWHKVSARHLDGQLLVMEGEIRPGQLIFPHTHSREDECAYVISGTVHYEIGDEVRAATAGTYVVKPRGVPHAFWNSGTEPARVLEMHVPATFERFYDELASIFATHAVGSQQWRDEFDRLNGRYGIIQHWDRVAEIYSQYGVGGELS
jgi:quercetin dioxygenase-like cupin family protein